MSVTDALKKALGDYPISEAQLTQFEQYFTALVETGRHTNLTAVLDEEGVAETHFADSLMPLRLGLIPEGARVIDVGSGAGFPGLPIKIMRPDVSMTLLEATGKKSAFIEKTAEALGLDVTVVNARAEEIAHDPTHRMWYDRCVSRAVANLPVLLELCSGFIKSGGRIIAYKGEKAEAEVLAAKSAATALGLRYVGMFGLEDDTKKCVLVYERNEKLKGQYPRKFSNIKKKSL